MPEKQYYDKSPLDAVVPGLTQVRKLGTTLNSLKRLLSRWLRGVELGFGISCALVSSSRHWSAAGFDWTDDVVGHRLVNRLGSRFGARR